MLVSLLSVSATKRVGVGNADVGERSVSRASPWIISQSGALLREFAASGLVGFDDFELEFVGTEVADRTDSNVRAAHNDDAAYAVPSFSGEPDELVDMVAGGGEMRDVAGLHSVVAARDDGLVVALDGGDVEVAVCEGEIL